MGVFWARLMCQGGGCRWSGAPEGKVRALPAQAHADSPHQGPHPLPRPFPHPVAHHPRVGLRRCPYACHARDLPQEQGGAIIVTKGHEAAGAHTSDAAERGFIANSSLQKQMCSPESWVLLGEPGCYRVFGSRPGACPISGCWPCGGRDGVAMCGAV